MSHPYRSQPERAFWGKTVASRNPLEISEWYRKKFDVAGLRVATAGSCFAQYIGKRLKSAGVAYIDAEPPPASLPPEKWLDFGYNMYSARFGNVYTARQLLQLFKMAFDEFRPIESTWTYKSGFVDPFRPTIEPEPSRTADDVRQRRLEHLQKVREVFERATLFVFTLGLTEAWASLEDGAIYPVCPGVNGGSFTPAKHRFINFTAADVLADLNAFLDGMRSINAGCKFLLTVSPVPLVATATAENVVVATSYSKAVLRAVAGQVAHERPEVDYFPSYEIVSSHPMRGMFFNPDLRTVSERGVDFVMSHFFKEHGLGDAKGSEQAPAPISTDRNTRRDERRQQRILARRQQRNSESQQDDEKVKCDEELLELEAAGPRPLPSTPPEILLTGDSHCNTISRAIDRQGGADSRIFIRALCPGNYMVEPFFDVVDGTVQITHPVVKNRFDQFPPRAYREAVDVYVFSMGLHTRRVWHNKELLKRIKGGKMSEAELFLEIESDSQYIRGFFDALRKQGLKMVVLEAPRPFRHNKKAVKHAENTMYVDGEYRRWMKKWLSEHDIDVIEVPQHCYDSEGFMLPEYQRTEDTNHGNDLFGDTMLGQLLSYVDERKAA